MEIGFFLKKTISYFVEPFGMVLALFVIGLYFLFTKSEGKAKVFLSFGFIIMFLYSYQPFSNFLVTNLENKYPKYDYKSDVKYIHVLGNGHSDDLSQPLSSRMGSTSLMRDIEGILIHLNTENSKLIFTGFAGSLDISTAQMNTDFAMALNVKIKDIIMNDRPKDTQEEAVFIKSILTNEPFVLVTSATHMPRAMMLFKSLGLNPIPAPTNFYKEKFEGYFRLPRIDYFRKSQIAMHEYIGILWSKLKASI
ncbi:MAG: YdcF family protein [Helicobacteraceae bacterium]|nr:YdcF family protein [Candidatus Sulfurimonas ponti]